MPFSIVRDDITRVPADAIVNAANEQLREGGGVCGAIFAAAGRHELAAACAKVGGCPTGSAVATPAFGLPARHVIHAVGPVWHGGDRHERALLASCYRRALELACELGDTSIAFPLISSGIYGYPKAGAMAVALGEIRAFLETHEMDVTLVLFDRDSLDATSSLNQQVAQYVDDVYVDASGYAARRTWESNMAPAPAAGAGGWGAQGAAAPSPQAEGSRESAPKAGKPSLRERLFPRRGRKERDAKDEALPSVAAPGPSPQAQPSAGAYSAPSWDWAVADAASPSMAAPTSLEAMLDNLDAPFSETLLALIDDRGLTDAQAYKRANVSRQHFSKIRSNPGYQPKKVTVLAFAVALELSLDETRMLLGRAGYALSHADKRDVIVEFFLSRHIYDVFTINQTLFDFDQQLLG